jgi:hypothetical protein
MRRLRGVSLRAFSPKVWFSYRTTETFLLCCRGIARAVKIDMCKEPQRVATAVIVAKVAMSTLLRSS